MYYPMPLKLLCPFQMYNTEELHDSLVIYMHAESLGSPVINTSASPIDRRPELLASK